MHGILKHECSCSSPDVEENDSKCDNAVIRITDYGMYIFDAKLAHDESAPTKVLAVPTINDVRTMQSEGTTCRYGCTIVQRIKTEDGGFEEPQTHLYFGSAVERHKVVDLMRAKNLDSVVPELAPPPVQKVTFDMSPKVAAPPKPIAPSDDLGVEQELEQFGLTESALKRERTASITSRKVRFQPLPEVRRRRMAPMSGRQRTDMWQAQNSILKFSSGAAAATAQEEESSGRRTRSSTTYQPVAPPKLIKKATAGPRSHTLDDIQEVKRLDVSPVTVRFNRAATVAISGFNTGVEVEAPGGLKDSDYNLPPPPLDMPELPTLPSTVEDAKNFDLESKEERVMSTRVLTPAMSTAAAEPKPEKMVGMLFKKATRTSLSSYKERWFEVIEGTMYYYKKRYDPDPLGHIPLRGAKIEMVDSCKWAPKKIRENGFIIDNPDGAADHLYELCAQTTEEKSAWLACIRLWVRDVPPLEKDE